MTERPLPTRRGRPPLPKERHRRQIRWFIAPETYAAIEAYAQPGELLGAALDRWIAERKPEPKAD